MKVRFQEKYLFICVQVPQIYTKLMQEAVLNRLFAVALKQAVSNLWSSILCKLWETQ